MHACAPPAAPSGARLRASWRRQRSACARVCRRAARAAASSGGAPQPPSVPWTLSGTTVSVPQLGYAAQAHILKGLTAAAARRDGAWVEARLAAVGALLPGATPALLQLRVADLAALLLTDDAALAARLVQLRCALPDGVDVAALAARLPALLLSPAPGAAVAEALAQLRQRLPPDATSAARLPALLAAQPALLDAALLRATLDELALLLPDRDAGDALAADPALLHLAARPAPRRDPNDEYYV